ncbi:MAG: hypothetical protein Q7S75_03770 [bacterium]|nr:hypothetical protein [bacterium]
MSHSNKRLLKYGLIVNALAVAFLVYIFFSIRVDAQADDNVSSNVILGQRTTDSVCFFNQRGEMVPGGTVKKECLVFKDVKNPEFRYAFVLDVFGKIVAIVKIDDKNKKYEPVWEILPPGMARL